MIGRESTIFQSGAVPKLRKHYPVRAQAENSEIKNRQPQAPMIKPVTGVSFRVFVVVGCSFYPFTAPATRLFCTWPLMHIYSTRVGRVAITRPAPMEP